MATSSATAPQERIETQKKLMLELIESNFKQVHLALTHYCYQNIEVQQLMFDLGGLCTETLVKFEKNFVSNDKAKAKALA